MFLPDRFIKGECPKCGAKDQYGDNCEVCGAAYAPTDLKNPYSAVSGAKPELRNSDHYFFKLSADSCQKFLREWTRSGTLQPEAANKMQEWLGAEGENKLTDWDISRDAPYFGFEIPDAPGKYFYVWLDAPVGYMGSFKNLCNAEGHRLRRLLEARIQTPSCTTSSARTSCISTRCSGPRCCNTPASARRPNCSRTASSPSTARR